MSNTRTLRRTGLCMALGLALAAFGAPQVYAANNDGSVAGRLADARQRLK